MIVLLLSADYLASETAVREMAVALRRRRAAGARVVPVLARPCFVEETPLGALQALPEDGMAISMSANADLAWLQVARSVRDIASSLSRGAERGVEPGAARVELLAPPLPKAPLFLGRDAQASEVVSALVAEVPQPVVLLGAGGIGKTTLSLAVLHRPEVQKKFGARRVFARLDGATSADAMIATVATAAGFSPGPNLRATLEAWLAKAPSLVVLDNLETPHGADRAATEAWIAEVAAIPDVMVLASVRGAVRPDGASWKAIELKPLATPHGVDLFCELAREHANERAAVKALVSPLGGVPLAIALLAHAAQGNSLENLRDEWTARRTAVLDRGGTDRHASWAACVEVSFASPRMTAEAERLCRVLAMLPEGAAMEDLSELLPGPGVASAAARVLAQVGFAYFGKRPPAHVASDARPRSRIAPTQLGRP